MIGLASIQGATIALLVLAITHLSAYGLGRYHERGVWTAERARLIAEAQAAADRLRAEGRHLAAELELARANVRVEYVERLVKVREVASATRACLSPATAAALNRDTPIREVVERPAPDVAVTAPTEPPQAATRQPDEPAGTSELAAAEWMARARAEHDACRAQVRGLVDWIRAATTRPTEE